MESPIPVKITANGYGNAKISVPKEILGVLDANVGDRLVFTPCDNGTVILTKLAKA